MTAAAGGVVALPGAAPPSLPARGASLVSVRPGGVPWVSIASVSSPTSPSASSCSPSACAYLLAQRGGVSAAQGVVLTQPSGVASPRAERRRHGSGAERRRCRRSRRSGRRRLRRGGHPGVYHLAAGARVCDLLQAAGGATGAGRALGRQSGRQADRRPAGRGAQARRGLGDRPVCRRLRFARRRVGAPHRPPGRSNLNLATVEQLDALPGVGPATAQKIVDYRTSNGGFRSVEDLKNVSGIGDAKFEALKDLVTV